MEKKVIPVQQNKIEVEFLGNITSEDVKKMMSSCEDGSCGCKLDMKKDFESVELDGTKPLLRFKVAPEKQAFIIKEMEKCNCSIDDSGKVSCC
jgi:hypothetical protein